MILQLPRDFKFSLAVASYPTPVDYARGTFLGPPSEKAFFDVACYGSGFLHPREHGSFFGHLMVKIIKEELKLLLIMELAARLDLAEGKSFKSFYQIEPATRDLLSRGSK